MKKLILGVLMLVTSNTYAGGPRAEVLHEGHQPIIVADSDHGHGGHGSDWVVPLLFGGILGYEINEHNNPPVIIQQPAISPPYQNPIPVYTESYEYDRSCDCYKHVYKQTGWR